MQTLQYPVLVALHFGEVAAEVQAVVTQVLALLLRVVQAVVYRTPIPPVGVQEKARMVLPLLRVVPAGMVLL
jgi:hypothetical protein